ncbi:MAG TPA: ADP-ribosylglycohydrolase family protein [Elainellaceae cyanobacterium]
MTPPIVPRSEQFSGCLIGQCVGDALGAPVEGSPPSMCQEYLNKRVITGQLGDRSRGHYVMGQYTDDSQLARELLQSYVARGTFDPADYAQRIAAIFAEGRIVGYGQATISAARRLIQGIHWEEAGTPPPAAGNGSAMRAAPIGLMFFDDPQQLIRAAHDQGRMTHQDSRCSAGAIAISGATALALQQQAIAPDSFLNPLSEWVATIDADVAAHLRNLVDWSRLPPEQAVSFIAQAGLDSTAANPSRGLSPFVIGSVLWSLYAFLRTPDNYLDTVCTAIAVGGDVDTTAAMAGAISGAHLGLDGIPTHLAERVTDQGTWNCGELVELAHQSYRIRMSA